jgi:hypothetical protein
VVDDPELGELIRIALANLPESEKVKELYHYKRSRDKREMYYELVEQERVAKLSTVRSITEAYAQIKLLDFQIEQLERKASAASKTRVVQAELILAKAELEAKRTAILAELREVMDIVPRHAFGRQPEADLKNWLALDVIGDSVYVLKYGGSFKNRGRPSSTEAVGVMSQETTIKYIEDLVKDKAELPLRVSIFRTESAIEVSKKLYEQLIEAIESADGELESDVYLSEIRQDMSASEYFLRRGKIYDTERDMRRDEPLGEDRFSEKDVERRLTTPRLLPRKYSIKFDADSKDLAERMIRAIKAKAKELGVERFVEIEQEETEFDIPDPEEKGQRGPRRGMRR